MAVLETNPSRKRSLSALSVFACAAALMSVSACQRDRGAQSGPAPQASNTNAQSSESADSATTSKTMTGTEPNAASDAGAAATDSDFATSSGTTSPAQEPAAESSQLNREPASTHPTEASPTATPHQKEKKKGAAVGAAAGAGAVAMNTKKGAEDDVVIIEEDKTVERVEPKSQAQSEVEAGGSSNRHMSQLANPSTEDSGTSAGLSSQAEIGEETGVVVPGETGERAPASAAPVVKEQAPRAGEVTDWEDYTKTSDGSASSTSALEAEMAAVKVDEKKDNPARDAGPDLSQEPSSRMPVHVGIVTITGLDKSIAALDSTNLYTDPATLARNESTRNAIAPVNKVDFGSYSHRDRREFQSVMESRLNNLDRKSNVLRAQAKSDTNFSKAQMRDQLDHVDGQIAALEEKADFADAISDENWDQFRSDFKNQMVSLESQMAGLSGALL